MKKENQTTKMKPIVVIALLLAILVCLSCLAYLGYWAYAQCWFGHAYNEHNQCVRCGKVNPEQSDDLETIDNVVVSEIDSNGIEIASQRILRASYGEYGITSTAETAKLLTATVVPGNATNRDLDWSIAWQNANSDWATSKSVSDYVSIAPASVLADEGAASVTVSCLKAFGEQIVITCASRDNASIFATCTVDYVKRIEQLTLTLEPSDVTFDTTYTIVPVPQYGVGTLEGEIVGTNIFLQTQEEIFTALDELSYFRSEAPYFSLSSMYMAVIGTYKCAENIAYTSDAVARTFAFVGDDVYDAFNTEETNFVEAGGKTTGGIRCSSETEALNLAKDLLKSKVNNAFLGAITNIDYDILLRFHYLYNYNGSLYGSGSQSAQLKFDTDSLLVHVTGVTLDQGGIVFRLS